jgi:hypothetical protein
LSLRRFLLVGCLGGALGCTGPKPDEKPKVEAVARPELLEPVALGEKPGQARSVIDVREQAKDGDEVVLTGKVPPANCKPFLERLAGFVLMDPKDLDDPAVKEELACDDAAT